MTEPVILTVWSDFLCPWCYVAAVRIAAVEQEMGEALHVEWRAFLLRPEAEARPLDRFTRYTESWARPADVEPAATFRTWSGEHDPPSHSLPPAVAGKAVLHEFGPDGFHRFHLALMHAYFAENRTISDDAVVADVAAACGLDADALDARLERDRAALAAEVVDDHRAALALGVTAVPSLVVDGEHVLPGALAVERYRKVVQRLGG